MKFRKLIAKSIQRLYLFCKVYVKGVKTDHKFEREIVIFKQTDQIVCLNVWM